MWYYCIEWTKCISYVWWSLWEKRWWKDRWNQSSKGRITFEFITNVRFALECNCFKFSSLTGFLLTDHVSLHEYLHKRGLASPASCHSCDEVDDVAHVLCRCPLYDDFRNLRNMSITLVNNNYMLLNVPCSKQSFYELERFAYRVFMRRKLKSVLKWIKSVYKCLIIFIFS